MATDTEHQVSPVPVLCCLCSIPSWNRDRCAVDQFERVVDMKVLKLRSQETVTGKKEFIVMGTTSVCGEGVQCKGRVSHTHWCVVVPHPYPLQGCIQKGRSISYNLTHLVICFEY